MGMVTGIMTGNSADYRTLDAAFGIDRNDLRRDGHGCDKERQRNAVKNGLHEIALVRGPGHTPATRATPTWFRQPSIW